MAWIGPVIGAVGGLLASQGSQQSGTVNNGPWSSQIPYLQSLFNSAQSVYNNQAGYTPPTTVTAQDYLNANPLALLSIASSPNPSEALAQGTAGYTPPPSIATNPTGLNTLQTIALASQAGRALNGSPLTPAASNNILATLNGNYLTPENNPLWDQMSRQLKDAYSQGTAAQTDAAFARAGALGGSAYDQTVARNQEGYGNALAQLQADIFGGERNRQLQAAQLAPGLDTAGYGDIGQLYAAGTAQQQAPWNALAQYGSLISGNYGSTQPYFTNPAASALGGAVTGYGLFSGWNPNNSINNYNSVGANNSGIFDNGSGYNLGLYGGT